MHVFISYASQDVAAADALCAALEAAALPCWIAPRDVRAGESYAAAIVQAINSCRLVVLVLSKSAIDSPHVLREVERASSKNRPVLSIHLDVIELTPELEYFLSAHQWLDASGGPIERIFPALIKSVRSHPVGKTSRSDGPAPSVGGIPRTLASGAKAPASHASARSHRSLLQIPFVEQLQHRNVGRVAILYTVGCYLVLEPFSALVHVLGLPEWTGRTLVTLMVLGFPLALIFAWVYEITPEGLKPTVEVPHGQSVRRQTGRRLDRAIIAVLALAVVYFVVDKFWLSSLFGRRAHEPIAAERTIATTRAAPVALPAVFAPPAHSIAVLPFVNMSDDAKQDYFSDGLSEELLNSLARITQLQVAARTSSFSFKGKQVDITDIAHKLNVGAILEGSVRKDGGRVRITAQLINTVTGFHLWSETYDRNLQEILALQSEIAMAVTRGLQATLLGDSSALIELGGTQNPAAFDAYLRAHKLRDKIQDQKTRLAAIAAYTEAIRVDPGYARAYVEQSLALLDFSSNATGPAVGEYFHKARAAADRAVALAPELGEAHTALGAILEIGLDFAGAAVEHERALALAPGNDEVLRGSGAFFSRLGRSDMALANARRRLVLDPLNARATYFLGTVLYDARHYREAIDLFSRALALDQIPDFATNRGYAYLMLREFDAAVESCATPPVDWFGNTCLAVAYHKLHRQSDAAAALAAIKAAQGDSDAFQYSEIYAQWGNIPEALQWLETAYRLRDPGLVSLKVEPFLDPLRQEPRFKEVERKLKFPN